MINRIILTLVVFTLIPFPILSQVPQESQQLKKGALIIGNGNYLSSVLANPENDARSMEAVLRKLGFIVFKYENLNQIQMKRAIDDFGLKLKGFDVGLFFYAGHGIQSNGYNYLIPVDALMTTERQVEYDCVQADRVLALMEGSGTKVNIIILDACRNNPFERSWTRSTVGRGLAFMNAPKGTIIAYATAPGSTASDGTGRNGLYTSAILQSILIPKINILQMFQQVRSIVNQKSNGQQIPWESTSLVGDFYFDIIGFNTADIKELTTNDFQNETPLDGNTDYMIDPRDNHQYKTIKIGNQVWMAENLNLYRGSGSWIYSNNSVYLPTYGRLYNWETAKNACPPDWHLPRDIEWDELATYISTDKNIGKKDDYGNWTEIGTFLKSINGWSNDGNGIDSYGFSAQPGGRRLDDGSYGLLSNYGQWWCSEEENKILAYFFFLEYNSPILNRISGSKGVGKSVRCIKNY